MQDVKESVACACVWPCCCGVTSGNVHLVDGAVRLGPPPVPFAPPVRSSPPLHAPCVVGEGLMEGVSRPIPVSLHLPPEALLVHSVGCVSPCTGLFGTTPAQTSQAAACTGTCSVGRYSLAGTALSCLQCPAGTFGSTTGLTNSSCSGQCQAGYACPAASTTSTVTLCGAGTYSLAGAGACSPCPPGETVV